MVNICFKCHKPIDEGDDIEMTVEGVYRQIASTNSFALYKGLTFKTGTLAHADCGEETIET